MKKFVDACIVMLLLAFAGSGILPADGRPARDWTQVDEIADAHFAYYETYIARFKARERSRRSAGVTLCR